MSDLTIMEARECEECLAGGPLATTETVDPETWEKKGMKVACFSCGALGPMADNLDRAVRAWNTMERAAEFMTPDGQPAEL